MFFENYFLFFRIKKIKKINFISNYFFIKNIKILNLKNKNNFKETSSTKRSLFSKSKFNFMGLPLIKYNNKKIK